MEGTRRRLGNLAGSGGVSFFYAFVRVSCNLLSKAVSRSSRVSRPLGFKQIAWRKGSGRLERNEI